MDIRKLTVAELEELKLRIDEEMAQRLQTERDDLLNELATLAQSRGYALEDLVGQSQKRRAKAARKTTNKPAPIKYRHPQKNDLSWSGRGRYPAWVKEWLESGKPLEKLAVK